MTHKIDWVKYKNQYGVRYRGKFPFESLDLRFENNKWSRIIGTIADSEGKYDTVINYDGTGMTFGIGQWTFTSGRLQTLLLYLNMINVINFETGEECTMYEKHFGTLADTELTKKRDSLILNNGEVYGSMSGKTNPRKRADKKRIHDLCMGSGKKDAFALAEHFIVAGEDTNVQMAQVQFLSEELKAESEKKRKPLGKYGTINEVLKGTWDTFIPAVFFNLWQNNPRAAYRLIVRCKVVADNAEPNRYLEVYKNKLWKCLQFSKFGNWSHAKPGNKSPRIDRIARSIKKYYGVELETK
jgi:hypothetical protein